MDKYTPIEVEADGVRYFLMDGVTRVEMRCAVASQGYRLTFAQEGDDHQ